MTAGHVPAKSNPTSRALAFHSPVRLMRRSVVQIVKQAGESRARAGPTPALGARMPTVLEPTSAKGSFETR